MEKLDIKDMPAGASAYTLADGTSYRIHLELKTPVDQLATADHIEVETRGYQIDKAGALLVNDQLEPITIGPQRVRIPMGNVRAGADSVKPFWAKQELPEDEAAREEILHGVKKLKTLPKTGEPGDLVNVGGELFAFSDGIYEQVRRDRAGGISVATAPTALDPETVLDLTP